MTRLLDLWADIRPYLGHAFIGIAVGGFICTVLISLVAAIGGVGSETLYYLAYWVMAAFLAAVVVGTFGILLYYNSWDRQQYAARHALRRSERL